jgi:hypothetical protein
MRNLYRIRVGRRVGKITASDLWRTREHGIRIYTAACRPISRQRPKYAHVTIEKVFAGSVFYVVRVMTIARQRVAKHIPAEANAQSNRASIARHRRGKQVMSTIPAVFSVGPVQSGCKRVEFRSWPFGCVECSAVECLPAGNGSRRICFVKIRYQETSSCRGIAIVESCYQVKTSGNRLRRLSVQWFVAWKSAIVL